MAEAEKLVTPQEHIQERQRRAARESVDAPKSDWDETVEGGRYKVGDDLVDSEGNKVKK